MNLDISAIPNEWFTIGCVLLVLAAVVKTFMGNPLRYLGHITYLSGALGTGKTSYVALVAADLRRNKITYYATFALEGAIPFDLSEDEWPQEAGIYIFLDELMALEEQDFIDFGQLSDGLAFARQKGQKVVLLSQAHRPQWGKLSGTIGVYCVTKGITLPGGRLNFMRWSAEPFTRMHGFKSPGALRSFIWIPSKIFKTYNSKLIFGYTCLKDLSPVPREELEPRRIRRTARRMLRKERARQLAKDEAQRIRLAELAAASPPVGQVSQSAANAEPVARPPGQQRKNPKWFTAGGKAKRV